MNDTGGDFLLSVVFALYVGTRRARGLDTKAFPALLEGVSSLVPSGCCREYCLQEFQFYPTP